MLSSQVAFGVKSRPESFSYAQDALAKRPQWVCAGTAECYAAISLKKQQKPIPSIICGEDWLSMSHAFTPRIDYRLQWGNDGEVLVNLYNIIPHSKSNGKAGSAHFTGQSACATVFLWL